MHIFVCVKNKRTMNLKGSNGVMIRKLEEEK